MEARSQFRSIVVFGLLCGGSFSCTTAEVRPLGPPVAVPPEYVSAPHPRGYELGDLRALFLDAKAPKLESVAGCDADFRKLRELTTIDDEIREGTREMVKRFPAQYHWCFYGKLIELENSFKAEGYIDQRQRNILTTYAFLVPLARAFMHVYKDSRYLRWSVQHYRHLSEWNFYRRLELSPETTSELVETSNPFGLWKEPAAPEEKSVLGKYNLGGVSQPPQRDLASAPPPTAESKETASKEGGAKESAPREPASKDGAAKEEAAKEVASKSEASQPDPATEPPAEEKK